MGNSRFLILPWLRIKGFASHVPSLSARVVPDGRTAGRGWQDRRHEQSEPAKSCWAYSIVPDYLRRLGAKRYRALRERIELAVLERLAARALAHKLGPEDDALVVRLAKLAIEIEKRRDRPTSERRGERTRKKKDSGGHGRSGAGDYPGVKQIAVDHPNLKPDDACPVCDHPLHEHKRRQHVHQTGSPTVTGTIYEHQVLLLLDLRPYLDGSAYGGCRRREVRPERRRLAAAKRVIDQT